MCSQDSFLVDVICVCFAAARMVGREAERIEVLICSYYGGEGVVVFVGGRGEARFDYGAGEGDGVIGLDVQTAGDGGGYVGGEIVP